MERVESVGPANVAERATRGDETVDLGNVALLPVLVNAHTHLELSWMQGRVPPGDAMPSWAARLIAERGEGERSHPVEQRRQAIVRAIEAVRASGTALVGDVTNSLEPWTPLAESGLPAAVFYELLGFRASDPVALRNVGAESARRGRLPPRPD